MNNDLESSALANLFKLDDYNYYFYNPDNLEIKVPVYKIIDGGIEKWVMGVIDAVVKFEDQEQLYNCIMHLKSINEKSFRQVGYYRMSDLNKDLSYIVRYNKNIYILSKKVVDIMIEQTQNIIYRVLYETDEQMLPLKNLNILLPITSVVEVIAVNNLNI